MTPEEKKKQKKVERRKSRATFSQQQQLDHCYKNLSQLSPLLFPVLVSATVNCTNCSGNTAFAEGVKPQERKKGEGQSSKSCARAKVDAPLTLLPYSVSRSFSLWSPLGPLLYLRHYLRQKGNRFLHFTRYVKKKPTERRPLPLDVFG
jgi:hypothetical protein